MIPKTRCRRRSPDCTGAAVILRDPAGALPYLRTTVVNLTRSRLRHLRVVRRMAPTTHAERPPSAYDLPEAAAVLRENAREILAALDTLTQRRRQVVVLRYWLDLTEAETAEVLGIAVGTVKSQTFRALAALRTVLEETR